MTFSTLGTCRLLNRWVSTPSHLGSKFCHLIITRLRELVWNLIRNLHFKYRLVLYLKPILWRTSIKKSCPLSISILPLRPYLLHIFGMHHKARNVHVVMYHSRMTLLLQIIRHPRHKTAHFISRMETNEGAYFDNLVNFKEYSWTLILETHP